MAVVEPGITVQYWCRRRSRWGRCLGGGGGDRPGEGAGLASGGRGGGGEVYAGAHRSYL